MILPWIVPKVGAAASSSFCERDVFQKFQNSEEKMSPLDPSRGEIHYQVFGEHHLETIVLVHGLDSAGVTFDTIIEKLSTGYQVLVYDQRGHGKSLMRGNDYSTQTMAGDLKALLDHLRIQTVHLLGHSLGGRTVVRFAELFPHRVKTVMIEDMEMIRRSKASPERFQEIQQFADSLDQSFKNKNFTSRQELIEVLRPLYGAESESLTYRRAKQNPDGSMTLLFNPGVSFRYGYQANLEDLGKALASVKKPILFIRSDPAQGSAMSPEGVQAIEQDIPTAKVTLVAGAGHTIHRSHADEFIKIVTDFIQTSQNTKKT